MMTFSAALAGLWQELAAKAAAASGSRSLILMLSLYQLRNDLYSQCQGREAKPQKEGAVEIGFEQAHRINFPCVSFAARSGYRASSCKSLNAAGQAVHIRDRNDEMLRPSDEAMALSAGNGASR
jgi:hypothetical protein